MRWSYEKCVGKQSFGNLWVFFGHFWGHCCFCLEMRRMCCQPFSYSATTFIWFWKRISRIKSTVFLRSCCRMCWRLCWQCAGQQSQTCQPFGTSTHLRSTMHLVRLSQIITDYHRLSQIITHLISLNRDTFYNLVVCRICTKYKWLSQDPSVGQLWYNC